jgi:hypothetical protein
MDLGKNLYYNLIYTNIHRHYEVKTSGMDVGVAPLSSERGAFCILLILLRNAKINSQYIFLVAKASERSCRWQIL